MNNLRILLVACAVAAIAGCGKQEKKEAAAVAPALGASAETAPSALPDEDPVRLASAFWQALSATNVESVVALSVDAGLDFADTDVDARMKAARYRDYVAVAPELFADKSFASAKVVKDRTSVARVSVLLTTPEGASEKVDLVCRRVNGKWRVDPFAEKDL